MAGKGSTPRPIPDREQFYSNWDDIQWGTLERKISELPADRQKRITERANELANETAQ